MDDREPATWAQHLEADPEERFSLTSSEPKVVERLRALHAEWVEGCAELRTTLGIETREGDLDAATAEKLQALGYGGDDGNS